MYAASGQNRAIAIGSRSCPPMFVLWWSIVAGQWSVRETVQNSSTHVFKRSTNGFILINNFANLELKSFQRDLNRRYIDIYRMLECSFITWD